jgi:hypothetical protein
VVIGLLLSIVAVLAVVLETVPGSSAGYVAKLLNGNDTAATNGAFTCATAVSQDVVSNTAVFAYPLTDASVANGASVADISGKGNKGAYVGTGTTSTATPIACPRDTGAAYVFDGKTNYVYTPTTATAPFASPTTFTEEVWFKTTQPGGKLIGWGNQQTGASGNYDRHLYLTGTGQLEFGVYNGGYLVIASPTGTNYADGLWHQAVVTFSATFVATMYVDGAVVVPGTTLKAAEAHTGFWRIGYDNLSGWPGTSLPAGVTGTYNSFFAGSMRYVAVYSTVMTAAQVAADYAAGR